MAAFTQPLFAMPSQEPVITNEEQPLPSTNPLPVNVNPTPQAVIISDNNPVIEEEDDDIANLIKTDQMKTEPSNQSSNAAGEKDKKPSSKKFKTNEEKERNDIYLNFENSSLANVVNYMAELRNINLLPDKALADIKVSLTIREPLTVDGAWNIFLTLLEVSGFSIVEVGGLHKVMPKDKKMTEALPIFINVPYITLPDSDLTVRYVMFLQNLQIDSVKDLLDSLLSDKHTLFPYTQANCFIITDRCYNIKSAMKVIHELDAMGQPETVVVMRLKRTNATDVKGLIEGLMSKKQDANPLARFFAKPIESTTEYFPSGTRIVAEDRTNQLILMGSPGPIEKIKNFIIEYIDVDLKAAESPLHIYELQYSDATAVAEILTAVTAAPDQGPGQQAAKYGAIRGGVKYFKSMKFTVDKDANRLIISCTDKQDWALLKSIIKDLDKPQPQVAIETLYVSINEDDIKQMGGSIRNKKEGQLGKGVDFQAASLRVATLSKPTDNNPVTLLGSMLEQLITNQGSTLLSFGKATNIWGVFEMLKSKTNASILSQPFLTVANKVSGKITVGSESNVPTEISGGNGPTGYGPVNADTSLEVEPQINLDGVIRLKINVNISEFTNASVGNKSVNQLSTNISMADGQVLVLGGFIQTKVSENTNKTPLLADIPIFGWFFKNQIRTVSRKYIFIFMAPTIVKPRSTPGVELYSKMKLHQATNDIESGIKTVKTNDPLLNWFFDPKAENYSHKVVDFANARYQPTTVDIKHDNYYRSNPNGDEKNQLLSQAIVADSPTMITADSIGEENIQSPRIKIQTNNAVTTKAKNDLLIDDTARMPLDSAMMTSDSVMTNPILSKPVMVSPNNFITNSQSRPTVNITPPISLPQLVPKVTSSTQSVTKKPDAISIKAAVDKRLGLAGKTNQQSGNKLVELVEGINQDEPFEGGFLKDKSSQPSSWQEPIIEANYVDPHPAKQDVLNLLGERMQQQRHISVDSEQLVNQRKKLKSLISQSFGATTNNDVTNLPRNEKQEALKALLTVPEAPRRNQPQLVVDPVKRNSLKNFLLQAEQPAPTTRNNPA
jgi:general secretion pathway protein D